MATAYILQIEEESMVFDKKNAMESLALEIGKRDCFLKPNPYSSHWPVYKYNGHFLEKVGGVDYEDGV